MKSGSVLVIVIGLLILWLGITGRFDCFTGTLNCMMGRADGQADPNATTKQTGQLGSALDRVAAKVGNTYHFPGIDEVLHGGTVTGTPPFIG